MLNPVIVGRVIQRFREERGLSQEVVSGLAGIGRTHQRRTQADSGDLLSNWRSHGHPAQSAAQSH